MVSILSGLSFWGIIMASSRLEQDVEIVVRLEKEKELPSSTWKDSQQSRQMAGTSTFASFCPRPTGISLGYCVDQYQKHVSITYLTVCVAPIHERSKPSNRRCGILSFTPLVTSCAKTQRPARNPSHM
eukprot:3088806-Amphidinium_carterae.1